MKRRDFIEKSCLACGSLAFMGAAAAFLEGCASSATVYKGKFDNGKLLIPLQSFDENGRVLVRSNERSFDILVLKKSPENYLALELKCTHQDQPLSVTNSGMFCSSHGSKFDFEGNVLKEPASKPLHRFSTAIVENAIQLTIK